MLDFITGSVDASNFQSVAQLAVAISLAYVVAGPEVSRLLRTKFQNSEHLNASLKGIEETLGATGVNVPSRQMLLSNARVFVEGEAMRTAPANAATTRFYIGVAAVSFAVLVYCTFCDELPRYLAFALVAAAVVALLRDPWVAASRASQLQELMDEVHRIARTFSGSPSTGHGPVVEASRTIAEMELQTTSLEDGIRKLKAL